MARSKRSARESRMLRAALAYAAKGLPVFPLAPGTNVPLISKKQGGHGFKDASLDPAQIRAWWEKEPTANIGVPTGHVSGIVVPDTDTPEAEAKLCALVGGTVTLTASTPRGRHRAFTAPEWPIKSGVALGGTPGLDVRGEGGYVCVPPSVRPEGRYRWENKAPLASLPDALATFLRAAQEHPDGTRQRAEPLPEVLPKGTRNNSFTVLAGRNARAGMSEAGILAGLRAENAQRGAGTPDHELVGIAARIATKEAAKRAATADAKPQGEPIAFVPILEGEAPPPPRMLVDRLLVDADVNVVAGPGGSGKSTELLHVTVCTALGRPVFGVLPVRREGPVLLVCPEDGQGVVRMTLESIMTGLDLNDADRAKLAARLFIMPDDEALNLREDTRRLGRAARALGAVLVVLDPLSNLTGGADEIDNAIASAILADLRRDVCRATGAAALLAHHIRKPDRKLGRSAEPSINEMRGGSAWGNGARLAFDAALQNGILTLTCTKANRIRQGFVHRIHLAIEAEPGEQESVWRRCTLTVAEANEAFVLGVGRKTLTENEQKLLAALDDPQQPNLRLTTSEWLGRSGLVKSSFYDAKKQLALANLAVAEQTEKTDKFNHPIYLFSITDKGREALAAYQERL